MNAKDKRRKGLSPGRVIVPLVTLVILFALWRTGQKWTIIPVGLALLLGYVVLPRVRRARVERFHRKALMLLATGKAAEIPELVKRSIFLQLVGPRSALDAKLGLAYLQIGRYDFAMRYLSEAIGDATLEERAPLEIGLAKALFVMGEFERAESMATAVQKRGIRLSEMMCILARSRLVTSQSTGSVKRTVEALIEDAETLSPSEDVRWMIELIRAEVALRSGSSLPVVGVDGQPRDDFLKSWMYLVQGRIWEREGKLDKAKSSFQKAAKFGKKTFVELELESLGTSAAKEKPGGAPGASSNKKKRRKRR